MPVLLRILTYVKPRSDCGSIPPATPFRQKGRKQMSKRSGQVGQVFLRNDRWVGRFYVDVAGQSKRMRKAIVLGMKTELTKTEARLKLLTTITAEGVNTPAHLERSLDRKSTRLNSSHGYISYAVFCLKKKKITRANALRLRQPPT